MSWTTSSTNQYMATVIGGYLPIGTFVIEVHFDMLGYADSATNVFTNYNIPTVTASSVQVSFGGGSNFDLPLAGAITNNIQNNEVRVCGTRAKIALADQQTLTFKIPPFVNAETRSTYGLGASQVLNSAGIIISDSPINPGYAFDGNLKTYYSSNNSKCYIGLDFGSNVQANIDKIRYAPNPEWFSLTNYFDGAIFTGSNDNQTWTNISAIDPQFVHTGWNTWLNLGQTVAYRYVRFEQTGGLSQCELAELEVIGTIYSTTPFAESISCDI